jgi:glyoxylase-like metal-dependent hydrolase (beta-lactamase superfamily II)
MAVMEVSNCSVTRREFIGTAASCSAHLMFVAPSIAYAARGFATSLQRRVVAQEPWGRLESLGPGTWSLISTPLDGDGTTLCNGGIIEGRDGVVLIESYATPAGAAWMARQARELTGKWPSHVVLTHFHADHTGGLGGLHGIDTPQILTTRLTRNLTLDSKAVQDRGRTSLEARMLADVVILDPSEPTEIDLGGRAVKIVPREGHTPSDVTVEATHQDTVWCGDLVWNRMFPNYRDAIPSRLSQHVRALKRASGAIYVPGHGPLADTADLQRYVDVIDHVEAAARKAFAEGIPAPVAASEFSLPPSLGEWHMFSPRYYEVALGAWERELKSQQ